MVKGDEEKLGIGMWRFEIGVCNRLVFEGEGKSVFE